MKALSLFSGIGGLDLAAEWAGMEIVAQCEIDDYCQKILRKHWPNVRLYDDITKLSGDDIDADVITGGYPCQPFSVAGKRGGAGDDRHLWPEMYRLIREIRPAWVVGENVAGHVSMGLDEVLSDLEGIGYATQAFVIPACAVDAPHRRDRCFVVGYADQDGQPDEPVNAEMAELQDVADAEHDGSFANTFNRGACKSKEERRMQQPKRPPNSNGIVADAAPAKRQRDRKTRSGRRGFTDECRWKPEPSVGRVANGIPRRMDRLRALGNAVVPQQAYPIFKAIMDYEAA